MLCVCALAALGLGIYKLVNQPVPLQGKAINLPNTGSLTVTSPTTASLSNNTTANDVPPSSASASLQTEPNNPGEASKQPLQSNTNINDPSLASNPLVQSLLESSNQ